ncbi:MAG: ATP-binding protein [FCB group bacterium]|nr:ATP-binding protein [FCB group bacterium]
MDKPIITGNTMIIPSNQEFLADVDVFLEGVLRGYGIDESRVADIAISVSELVNNAIHHAHHKDTKKTISIKINRDKENVIINISDQGTGFNPEDINDPLAEENLLKDTGRGLFIVKSLMDKVDFEITDQGTSVTITKSIK